MSRQQRPKTKKTETTASIDQPDIEKTVEVPAEAQTVPVDEKKKATVSIDQPVIEKTVEVPANEPTVPVDEKKKATASIDQPAIKKTVKALPMSRQQQSMRRKWPRLRLISRL